MLRSTTLAFNAKTLLGMGGFGDRLHYPIIEIKSRICKQFQQDKGVLLINLKPTMDRKSTLSIPNLVLSFQSVIFA